MSTWHLATDKQTIQHICMSFPSTNLHSNCFNVSLFNFQWLVLVTLFFCSNLAMPGGFDKAMITGNLFAFDRPEKLVWAAEYMWVWG